jgi:hypothetical protein
MAMLAVLAAGAGVYFLKRKAKEWKRTAHAQVEEQSANPELRTAKAMEMLHAERLPDGYYSMYAVSLPGMEELILGDQPPRPTGEPSGFAERSFLYKRTSFQGPASGRIRAFVVGDTDDPSGLREGAFSIGTNAIIRRGMLNLGGGTILYCAQRGEMSVKDDHRLGLQVVSLIDCPEDRNLRLAIWFGPDVSPGTPVAQFDVAGTVADENELRRFLSNFRVCSGRR